MQWGPDSMLIPVTMCTKFPYFLFVISQLRINFHNGLHSCWGLYSQYWKTGWCKWSRTSGSCSIPHSHCFLICSLLPPGNLVSEKIIFIKSKRFLMLDAWKQPPYYYICSVETTMDTIFCSGFVLCLKKISTHTWVKLPKALSVLLTFMGN